MGVMPRSALSAMVRSFENKSNYSRRVFYGSPPGISQRPVKNSVLLHQASQHFRIELIEPSAEPYQHNASLVQFDLNYSLC
jgi:hypothetical protein